MLQCPDCKVKNFQSEIHITGCSTTLLAWSPYYDKDGKQHLHDPNVLTINYKCSKGHTWNEKDVIRWTCGCNAKKDAK